MTARSNSQSSDTPMGQLLQDALNNIQSLIRSELRLAKTEVSRDAKQAGIAGGLLVGGMLLGLYAFGWLLSAIVEMLEGIMPEWLAELTIAITLGGIAGLLAMTGLQRMKETDLVPHETIASLEEVV